MTATDLRPYQKQIVESVIAGIEHGGTGQVHMACGTGKTVVGHSIAASILTEGNTVAVLLPSLALAAQTLRAWSAMTQAPLDVLAVCSDDTVADAPVHTTDLRAPVTTQVSEIDAWLARPKNGLGLVLCTYNSAHRLAEAVRKTGPLDLVICDEAHHLAGDGESATRTILRAGVLPARRRLFMTATPRLNRDPVSATAKGMVGMDDETVFGPVLGSYGFAEAIADGWIADYELAVICVPQHEARAMLLEDQVTYVDEHASGQSLQTAAAQLALIRAREGHQIRRMLTFHTLVESAASFAHTLRTMVHRLEPRHYQGLYAAHVSGSMDHVTREAVLDCLRVNRDGWAVVSSARCLSEGVDIPAVDAILFADPKHSPVDITQAIGRAVRLDPESPAKKALVVIPLVVPERVEHIGDLDPGQFETLWNVVRALREFDDELGVALDAQRHHDEAQPVTLPEKITVQLAPGMSDELLRDLSLTLVRQATNAWWEGYHAAKAYREEHGDLLVPDTYVAASGLKLGSWVRYQRSQYAKGWMGSERTGLLDELGMVWNILELRFAENLASARAFRAEHGHLNIPYDWVDEQGRNIGAWFVAIRNQRKKGTLANERIAALDTLGMCWSPEEARWSQGLAQAAHYRAENNNLNVPFAHVTADGFNLGTWINTQRTRKRKGQLKADRAKALDGLGMVWDAQENAWRAAYSNAAQYFNEHGHLRVPQGYICPDGSNLHDWLHRQRALRRGRAEGSITPERIALLDALNMPWGSTVADVPAASRGTARRTGAGDPS